MLILYTLQRSNVKKTKNSKLKFGINKKIPLFLLYSILKFTTMETAMELIKSNKSLTVKLIRDKIGFAYICEKSGNIIYDFDEYRLNRTFNDLKGRKGVFIEKYTALSEIQLKKIQKQNNDEVERLIKKIGLARSGGIAAMLSNKGY